MKELRLNIAGIKCDEQIDDLMDKFNLDDLTILENVTDGHNKVYILLRGSLPESGEQFMIRLWGKHGNVLANKTEAIDDVSEYDDLIAQKLSPRKGYTMMDYSTDKTIELVRGYMRAAEFELKKVQEMIA